MEGSEGKEEWRPDRTSAPEGWLGEGRGSHSWQDLWELGGSGGSAPSISPVQVGPGRPAGLPDLVLCSLGPPLGHVGPRSIGGRWGENKRGRWGGALWDWRIRGGTEGVSPTHLGPRKPARLPGLVLHSPGPPLTLWVLRAWEGGREGGKGGGKKEESQTVGLSRTGKSAEVWRAFPPPIWALGSLLGSWFRSFAFQGPLWLHWSWNGGRKRRGGCEVALWDRRIRGGTAGISPTLLGPQKPAGLPGQVLCSPGPLPGHIGPRGVGGRQGEKRRGGRGGSLWDGESGEAWRVFTPPTWAPGSLLVSQP